MVKKIDGITKHTLNLHEGDWQKLQAMFPEHGASVVIRKLVRKFIATNFEENQSEELIIPVEIQL